MMMVKHSHASKTLVETIKHILRVFPEAVIIRVLDSEIGEESPKDNLVVNQPDKSSLIFVNNTASEDFYDKADPVHSNDKKST